MSLFWLSVSLFIQQDDVVKNSFNIYRGASRWPMQWFFKNECMVYRRMLGYRV